MTFTLSIPRHKQYWSWTRVPGDTSLLLFGVHKVTCNPGSFWLLKQCYSFFSLAFVLNSTKDELDPFPAPFSAWTRTWYIVSGWRLVNVTDQLLEDVRVTTFLENAAVSSTWYTCRSGLDVVTVHPTRAVKEVMCSRWTSLGIAGKTVNGVSKITSF